MLSKAFKKKSEGKREFPTRLVIAGAVVGAGLLFTQCGKDNPTPEETSSEIETPPTAPESYSHRPTWGDPADSESNFVEIEPELVEPTLDREREPEKNSTPEALTKRIQSEAEYNQAKSTSKSEVTTKKPIEKPAYIGKATGDESSSLVDRAKSFVFSGVAASPMVPMYANPTEGEQVDVSGGVQ